MKSLGLLALILALGVGQLYAQQEIDPDHFDQQASKIKVQHLNYKKGHHSTVASKHGKVRHHRHASA